MKDSPLLKKNIFFYVTEFVCGISVMAVEIGASRLLAPYFSSSQVIWTLIIGSIMIAMAIGNFLGGKLADKKPSLDRLYLFILIAGVYICVVPFFGRYIIALMTAFLALFVTSGLLIWSSLLSCFILFVPPLLFLGMVTPSLIKYSMGDGKTSGKVVGLLEALNTIGSIIGTFLPTFLTIPTIGTSMSFFLFGGLLVVLCLVYFVFWFISYSDKRKKEPVIVDETPVDPLKAKKERKALISKCVYLPILLALAITGGILDARSNFVFWNEELLYQGESDYNYLQVKKDQDGTLSFSTNVMFGVQSIKKKDNSLTGMYYDYCLAAPYYANVAEKGSADVLVLGNGTGTYASLLKNSDYMPYNANIEGVEIDQKIIDISKEYFGINDDIQKVYCDDGRYYIAHTDKKYDVIMVDAYSGISVPFQMASVEFFTLVYEHLNDNGVMVFNFNMFTEGKDSLDHAVGDTVASVFPSCLSAQIGTNLEFFALKDPKAVGHLSSYIDGGTAKPAFQTLLEKVNGKASPYVDGGIRLTDDNADVELRSMGAIDLIIKDELSYYREIYKEKGFAGLIEYLLG